MLLCKKRNLKRTESRIEELRMMAKKKILVVEDNMLNREMLKNILFPEYELSLIHI